MDHKVYSCLKMLEALHKKIIGYYNMRQVNSSHALGAFYESIYYLLEKHLEKEKLQFIPKLSLEDPYLDQDKMDYMLKLNTACGISIAYLQSLEMDLDKELSIKKEELMQKEKQIELREKHTEYLQKLLNKSLDAIKQFPELQRSKIVEDIKKSHRQIEKNSKKN